MPGNKAPYWKEWIPDPIEDVYYIGDKLNLQILACVDGAWISGHWETIGRNFPEVIFVSDWLTKEVISNDKIDFWCFTRDL